MIESIPFRMTFSWYQCSIHSCLIQAIFSTPGEHIDYCGYAVFPMALEQDIVIAFTVNDEDTLKICNTDGSFE